METSGHTPPTMKSLIKVQIIDLLYDYSRREFKQRLAGIGIQNAVILRHQNREFFYKNVLYTPDGGRRLQAGRVNLVPELHETMNEYLKDVAEVTDKEMTYVLGYINRVLNASNYLPDYLLMFPEALHEPVNARISMIVPTHKYFKGKIHPYIIKRIVETNQEAINLIKSRMVLNLIA